MEFFRTSFFTARERIEKRSFLLNRHRLRFPRTIFSPFRVAYDSIDDDPQRTDTLLFSRVTDVHYFHVSDNDTSEFKVNDFPLNNSKQLKQRSDNGDGGGNSDNLPDVYRLGMGRARRLLP